MTHETPRDALGEALRSLPRARPAGDFTERVLERAGTAPRARALPPGALRWATAAVAALGLAGALSLAHRPGGGGATEPERRARTEALEAERLRLAAELAEVRRLAASLEDPAPMLYLGGDDEIDLVIDLDRLARRPAGSGASPVAYRGARRH